MGKQLKHKHRKPAEEHILDSSCREGTCTRTVIPSLITATLPGAAQVWPGVQANDKTPPAAAMRCTFGGGLFLSVRLCFSGDSISIRRWVSSTPLAAGCRSQQRQGRWVWGPGVLGGLGGRAADQNVEGCRSGQLRPRCTHACYERRRGRGAHRQGLSTSVCAPARRDNHACAKGSAGAGRDRPTEKATPRHTPPAGQAGQGVQFQSPEPQRGVVLSGAPNIKAQEAGVRAGRHTENNRYKHNQAAWAWISASNPPTLCPRRRAGPAPSAPVPAAAARLRVLGLCSPSGRCVPALRPNSCSEPCSRVACRRNRTKCGSAHHLNTAPTSLGPLARCGAGWLRALLCCCCCLLASAIRTRWVGSVVVGLPCAALVTLLLRHLRRTAHGSTSPSARRRARQQPALARERVLSAAPRAIDTRRCWRGRHAPGTPIQYPAPILPPAQHIYRPARCCSCILASPPPPGPFPPRCSSTPAQLPPATHASTRPAAGRASVHTTRPPPPAFTNKHAPTLHLLLEASACPGDCPSRA